jgi:hypothetical protein
MENFLKDKFSTCMNYIKNKITHNENYQLIETQRKIFYFSKFTLDVNEFLQIHNMIHKIKENILKSLIDTIKYCSKGINQM